MQGTKSASETFCPLVQTFSRPRATRFLIAQCFLAAICRSKREMKHQLFIVLILSFLTSCQTSTSTHQFIEKTDKTVFKRFSVDGEKGNVHEYLLDRKHIKDSLLTFRYYRDTTTFKSFEFDISSDQFELISSNIDHGLSVVDTIYLTLNNEELEIFKFEKVNPPPDGAFGVLLNKKYGMIGFSPFDWGNKTILTKWNDQDFEQNLKSQLINSGSQHLSRKHPIPLPSIEELGKLDTLSPDTIEPELKEKN